MNRRTFLKTIGMSLVAATAPAIILPSTRTIIDLNPHSYRHLDGQFNLMDRILTDQYEALAQHALRVEKHMIGRSILIPLGPDGVAGITIIPHPPGAGEMLPFFDT